MKKCLFSLVLFGGGLCLLASCNSKTPEQAAQEALDRDMREYESSQMAHEKYIDSLVNVAVGLEGETLVRNRSHALSILRSEYPQLNDKWDKIEVSIANCEIWDEDY